MKIRREEQQDFDAIAEVNRAAFPTPVEADLVGSLRERAGSTLSLVAEEGGAIIGHIMFSQVRLMPSSRLRLLGLGL